MVIPIFPRKHNSPESKHVSTSAYLNHTKKGKTQYTDKLYTTIMKTKFNRPLFQSFRKHRAAEPWKPESKMTLSGKQLITLRFFVNSQQSRPVISVGTRQLRSTTCSPIASKTTQDLTAAWSVLIPAEWWNILAMFFVRITKACFIHRGLTNQSTGS